jgi:hypothetical protein
MPNMGSHARAAADPRYQEFHRMTSISAKHDRQRYHSDDLEDRDRIIAVVVILIAVMLLWI